MKATARGAAARMPDNDFPETGNVSRASGVEPSSATLTEMLTALLAHYGEQNWWPAASPFEVMVGAVLVQNTNWNQAEKAIANLRAARVLSAETIGQIRLQRLQRLIRPSGFYRQKAATIKRLAAFINRRYAGSVRRMGQTPTSSLRSQLLSLKGIGTETADAILLYALGHEVIVSDAYSRRVLERHGFQARHYSQVNNDIKIAADGLGEIRWHQRAPRHPPSRMSRLLASSPANVPAQIHAAFVRLGSEFCHWQANCMGCPLQRFLTDPPGAVRPPL